MVNPQERVWHSQSLEEVVNQAGTHAQEGLPEAVAAERLRHYGRNVLTARRGHGPLVRFLLQFHQPLIYILLAATLVTLLLDEYIDAAVIFGVVLVNAVISFIQESRALQAIAALAQTLVTETTVIRGGRKLRVDAAELVPGDLVLLQSGDKVPADLRLLRCRDLQVAEAALTGESVPVEKALTVLPAETPLAERKNMAYASTLVTYGQGTGVVVATGDHTEVGRISQLIAGADDLQTPLTRRIAEFSKVLLYIILGLAALTFAVGLLRGQAAVEMLMASVAMAVAAIPEGLPAAVTITLAIGVSRMARRRAIIRKLPAVETLGSTTVICSDKTGTLTQNQMTVTRLVAGDQPFTVRGAGYAPQGDIIASAPEGDAAAETRVSVGDLHRHVALLECLRGGVLCNDSQLVQVEGRWDIQGDPTEGALLVVAAKAGLEAHVLREELPRVDSIPFESEHQYMATLHDQGLDRPRVVYAKGSVEAILRRCREALDGAGQPQPLNADAIHAQVADLAAGGLRVLAFARRELPPATATLTHDDVRSGLVFVGLQAMIDPPRPEAQRAIQACQSAGIRVKMITGDHAGTAVAIAGQLGLDTSAPALTGQALNQVSDADLVEAADRTAVFARVAPEQKLRLVRALQTRGHIVAMTGDGVNDAPALKQANIGVAMGKGGTDVAREAADMVLTDDNFASIEAAVEEGRGVFDNLTKFIVWTLPTNVAEGLVILAAILVGSALPIAPVQILWVNMMTAVMLGLMLAFEPKEPGIMARPPRAPQAPILTGNLLKRVGFVSLLSLLGAFGMFSWMVHRRAAPLAEAQTVTTNAIVIAEIFYLFNCRSLTMSMFHIGVFTNKPAIAGAFGMLLLQLLLTYLRPLNHLFNTAPIGADVWLILGLFGIAVYVIVEIEKYLVGYTLQGETFTPGSAAGGASQR